EYPPPVLGGVERAIGHHVAALVPDGATVQVGVGAIPQAVLEALVDHRELALHSLLVDSSVTLVERGVVTNALKRIHRGRMGTAVTSPRLLVDWVVTEYGAASLRGKGERGRAEALLAVAHPRFQGELERALTSS